MKARGRAMSCARSAVVRATIVVIAFLACALVARIATADETERLTPIRVSAHGWFFEGHAGMASAANRGFMSNAGFVVTDDGVVVFDALGTPVLGRAMVAAIRTITSQPIRRVIVSHYHADHVYGLQALKEAGAEIWAYRKGEAYFTSGVAEERLAQRRADLFPWVDDKTRVVRPDVWLDGDVDFRMGGVTFRLIYSGGGHSPEDLMMYVVEDRLLFAGDLIFSGRIPFVGNGDSRGWLQATKRMLALSPAIVVPGHGPLSRDVERDLTLTRDYLVYLRETMGRAAKDLTPFEEAYAKTDWSLYAQLPAFEPANRINAWGTYLRMEQEELDGSNEPAGSPVR
jgi:glyoxylase-like metal-dependent hydrolase (beta-lactamase superfamily II)